jgi:predicted ATPase
VTTIRLVYEAPPEISETFEAGAARVDLVGFSDPAVLLQEMTAILHVRSARGQTVLAVLITALQYRQALMILDNCEHLIEAIAQLS